MKKKGGGKTFNWDPSIFPSFPPPLCSFFLRLRHQEEKETLRFDPISTFLLSLPSPFPWKGKKKQSQMGLPTLSTHTSQKKSCCFPSPSFLRDRRWFLFLLLPILFFCLHYLRRRRRNDIFALIIRQKSLPRKVREGRHRGKKSVFLKFNCFLFGLWSKKWLGRRLFFWSICVGVCVRWLLHLGWFYLSKRKSTHKRVKMVNSHPPPKKKSFIDNPGCRFASLDWMPSRVWRDANCQHFFFGGGGQYRATNCLIFLKKSKVLFATPSGNTDPAAVLMTT